jgi:hypothetical protein
VPATAKATPDGQDPGLSALPEPFLHIVRAAYGDATGHIFLISAGIAVVGVIAALLLRPVNLRTTLDLKEDAPPPRELAEVSA